MSKHTPGQWQISGPSSGKGSSDDGGDYAVFIRDEAGGVQILAEAIYRTESNTYQPVEANAKLIAAAPDLLAALIAMESSGDANQSVCSRWIDARAAIKKATE